MNKQFELPRIELAGRFKLEVRGPDGELKHETDWFDNLITDAGLEALGESKATFRYAAVGTNNTAPANGNTTLGTQIALCDWSSAVGSTQTGGVDTGTPRFGWERRTYPFAQGDVVGNVAEVGIGWDTTVSLFSRSLVSPAVTVVALDQLTVTYEIRLYLPTVDTTGTVTIGGTTYNYTCRALYADASTTMTGNFGWRPGIMSLGATTRDWCVPATSIKGAMVYGSPAVLQAVNDTTIRQTLGGTPSPQTGGGSGIDYSADAVSSSGYVANSKQCKFTTSWNTSHGNEATGVKAFAFFGMFGTYQCVLDATILKDNTKQLTITWYQNWARR